MYTTRRDARFERSPATSRAAPRRRRWAGAIGLLLTVIGASGAPALAGPPDDVAPEISIEDLQAFQADGEIWWLIDFEEGFDIAFLRQKLSATFSCETPTTKVGWEWHEGVETAFLLDRGFVLIDGNVVFPTGRQWDPADPPMNVRCLSASWDDASTEAQFAITEFTIDPADIPEQLVEELVMVWDFATASPVAPPTPEEVQAAEAFLTAQLHQLAADEDEGDGQLWMNVSLFDEFGEAVDVLASPSAIDEFLSGCAISIDGEPAMPGDGAVGWLEDGSILFDTGLSLLDLGGGTVRPAIEGEIDRLTIESTCLVSPDSEIPLPDDLVEVEGFPAEVVPYAPLSGAAFWELVTDLVDDPPADDEELAIRVQEALEADGVTALEEEPVVDELLESQQAEVEALEEEPVVDELLESQQAEVGALEEEPVVDELLESQQEAPADQVGQSTGGSDGSSGSTGWLLAGATGFVVVLAVGAYAWRRRSAAAGANPPG